MQLNLFFSFVEWMCEFSRSSMAGMLSSALLIGSLMSIPLYLLSMYLYGKIMDSIEKKKKRKSIVDRIRRNSCLKED